MRERLTRGKRTNNDEGEFVYGIPVEGEPLLGMGKETYIITKPGVQWVDGVYMTYDECIEVDPKTVGDYTGLTDRNNKMIFEGDIVNFQNNDGEYSPYEVKWRNSGFLVLMNGKPELSDELDDFFCRHCHVIGNIYDNPELLDNAKIPS